MKIKLNGGVEKTTVQCKLEYLNKNSCGPMNEEIPSIKKQFQA